MLKTYSPQDYEGRLVGLMTSFYKPGAPRLVIAHRTLEAYQAADIPVVMVDGSPDESVRDGFRERGATVLYKPEAKLATSARLGAKFIIENGGDHILKHEPEKDRMPHFAEEIDDLLGRHDLVVIGRTPEAMNTLPPTQRETETIGGRLMSEHLGFPADSLSGGRAFARMATEELINYDTETWGDDWMHLHIPILSTMARGGSVVGLQVPLLHPPEMTAEETGNADFDAKRTMQLDLHARFINQVRERAQG